MKQVLIVGICCGLALFANVAMASRLGGFEQDVTTPFSGSGSSVPSDESSGEDCSPLFEDCSSDNEEQGATKKVKLYPRTDTHLRAELRYHNAFDGVTSYDLQVDKDYGKYGVSAKYYHYVENQPAATLDVAEIYMLYRPPVSKQFQVDVGVGVGSLMGSQVNSGLSLELPMKIHLSDHVSLAVSPSVTYLANQMVEMNSALQIRGGNSIYSIGYKSLRGPTVKLEGPYVGIAHLW